MYRKLFSVEAKAFTSENAEVLDGVDLTGAQLRGRGIWAMDRGGDRKNLLEPLLDRGARFVIRSTGRRAVIDRHGLPGSVTEVAGLCRRPHQACIVKIQGHRKRPIRCATAPNRFACRAGRRSSGWW